VAEPLLKHVEQRAECALQFNGKQTLATDRRIRQRVDFESAFRADCITNKWFVVYSKRNDFGVARLGMVASKRVMPRAVSRNFAKRLIRDVFRLNFTSDRPLDIVVRARRPLSSETSKEGRLALMQLLSAIRQ
jgi:ribonuclease P protein component